MGISDFFSAIGDKIGSAAHSVSSIIGDFGKNATSTISDVINTIGHVGGSILDKGTSIINNTVSTAGGVLNTGISTVGNIGNKFIDVGGGLVNKGIETVDSIGSTVSFIPIAIIAVGGLVLYELINNAKPVSEGVATVAQSVGPYVAMAR